MLKRRRKAAPTPPAPTAAHIRHLLVVLGAVLAPHVAHLPLWTTLGVLAAMAWCWTATLHRWPEPPSWLRLVLTLAAAGGIYASFGRINGLHAGVALLTAMTALKLTELKSRRDARVLIALMYFLLVTHFLFDQALWMAAYLLGCAWLITATLIESSHGGALPPRRSLRLAAPLLLQALPLMVALFVLFPRIPGPLWGLPADSGATRAGLGDSMAPGDIQRLILSDAVAFRVRFDGAAPPRRDRYWRGPVFSFFDGHSWRPGTVDRDSNPPVMQLNGAPVDYEITLEPSRDRGLYALDLPDPSRLPPHAALDGDAQLRTDSAINERRLVHLRSYPQYRLQPSLTMATRQSLLALPRDGNPQARALAGRWRAQGLDDAQVIAAAMRLFHVENFHYTLDPPALGRNAIDDFLFKTRAGFCEHYASSFTFLMRAAGIPARVVTGYQGGSRNAVGDYYVIRDADAHAWSEVWLDGHGWVREDPTAAVAPSRVDDGVNAALDGTSGLPGFLEPHWRQSWRYALEARWDWVNTQWNRWFLAYGPDLQQRLMNALGLIDWSRMILALTVLVTGGLGALGLVLALGARPARIDDTAARLWRAGLRRLRRQHLQPDIGESASAFAERVAREHPEWAAWARRLSVLYLRARYLQPDDAAALRALRQLLRQRR